MTTATGRLWRRAPLWRLVLTATLAFGVLTALYPAPSVHLPRWLHLPAWLHLPPGKPPAPAAAQPRGSVEAADVPAGPPFHGTMTVAGRLVPLPAGDWHELVAARAEEEAEISDIVLGRWEGGALTGLLRVLATTGPADNGRQAGVVKDCNSYANFAVKWADAGRTCWLIRKIDVPAPGTDPEAAHTIIGAALLRLQGLGVTVPAWLATAVWSHAQGSEMMTYQLMVASGRNANDQSAALAALQGWMARFAPLLGRGFEGKLDRNVAPALARDPGFTSPRG